MSVEPTRDEDRSAEELPAATGREHRPPSAEFHTLHAAHALPTQQSLPPRWRWLLDLPQLPSYLLMAWMALLGCLAFVNGIPGEFLFDDVLNITSNPAVHKVWPPWEALTFNTRRPVLYYSMALNYAVCNNDPRGYHLVNMLIHVFAGCMLFALIARTLQGLRARSVGNSYNLPGVGVAWTAAAIWMVHPLQTQSVTYIVQRTESLAGLFAILCLWGIVRGAQATRWSWLWYLFAVAMGWLGLWTKETCAPLAVVALLYDRIYLSTSWKEWFLKRSWVYLLFFLSWGPFLYNSIELTKETSVAMGLNSKLIKQQDYAQTQPEVILHYLRLTVWPSPMCMDYRWPVQHNQGRILAATLALGALGLVSVLGLIRFPKIAFLGCAFFLLLAPSSSLLPLVDLAFEHRMYLPLAPLAVLFTLAAREVLLRIARARHWNSARLTAVAVVCALSLIVLLTGLTIRRNFDYYSDVVMWQQIVDLRPLNPRAYHNWAVALEHDRRYAEAANGYRGALRHAWYIGAPTYTYHTNLGNCLAQLGHSEEAVGHYQLAVALGYMLPDTHHKLGWELAKLRRWDEAISHYQTAVAQYDAKNAGLKTARYNLGESLAAAGRTTEAIHEFRTLLRDDVKHEWARIMLARTLFRLGQIESAADEYRIAMADRPQSLTPQLELAWILTTQPAAKATDGEAMQKLLQPLLAGSAANDPLAWEALAAARAAQGDFAAAVANVERAQELTKETSATPERLANQAEQLAEYRQQRRFVAMPSDTNLLGR